MIRLSYWLTLSEFSKGYLSASTIIQVIFSKGYFPSIYYSNDFSKGYFSSTIIQVISLKVISRIPLEKVCDSLLFGNPLIVHSTTCWKMDWDELELNLNNFKVCNKDGLGWTGTESQQLQGL